MISKGKSEIVDGNEFVDSEPGPVLRIGYGTRLRIALRRQLKHGKISRKDYQRLVSASWNREFISGFVEEVEQAAKIAGDFIDDVKRWFKILVQWLIDNWELVARILFSLLLLI